MPTVINFPPETVFTGKGGIVEIQVTAEGFSFTDEQFAEMMSLAKKGCCELAEIQERILC